MTNSGVVLQLNISAGGVPKRPIETACVSRLGIQGDEHLYRYHGGPRKALLLMAAELIDALAGEGFSVYYGALGENITTKGLYYLNWQAGQRYRVGTALIELTEKRAPLQQAESLWSGYSEAYLAGKRRERILCRRSGRRRDSGGRYNSDGRPSRHPCPSLKRCLIRAQTITGWIFKRRHPQHFAQFDKHPERALWLSTIFACSHFLAEELLRHPEWLASISDLNAVLSIDDFGARLAAFQSLDLALFRRQELVRIVLRDRLELASLSEITEEISNLADAILSCALARMQAGVDASFCVIALGKLGGRELNYSSDVDLLFVYGGHDKTREFFTKLARQYVSLLSTRTAGGSLLSRGSAAAAGRQSGRGCDFPGCSEGILRQAGASVGIADADQGPGMRGRCQTRVRIAGVCGTTDLRDY